LVDNLKRVRATYWDGQVRGLGILTQPSGVASYFWSRRINGRLERHLIGRVGEVTLDQARTAASGINTRVGKWQDGGSVGPAPIEEAKFTGDTPTLQQMFDAYCAIHLVKKAKAAKALHRDQQLFQYLTNAKLAQRPVGGITRKELREMHASLGSAPVIANRVLQLFQRVINWNIEENEYDGTNAGAKLNLFPEFSRERVPQDSELRRVFAELSNSPQYLQDFVWLSLLTGQRLSDVLGMRWADLSLQDAVWHVPKTTKSGRPFDQALSPKALRILEARPRGEWVFPSDRSDSGRMTNVKEGWYKLLKRADVKNLRIHDLRRCWATRARQLGADQVVIGRGLGHSRGSAATSVYLAPGLDDLRPVVANVESSLVKLLPAG
jgi:integrase